MCPLSGWHETVMEKTGKINTSVATSGIIGAVASPVAVFCTKRVMPRQMDWLRNVVADHVVAPHLEWFERAAERLHRAQKKRCETDPEYCQPHPALAGIDPESPRGRALTIADGLVTTLLAWNVDFFATLGSQHFINKRLKIDTSPVKTTFVDFAVSLGAVAAMPTLVAKPSEYMNHKISTIIQKMTGMPKDHAEDFSVPIVYAGIPNLIGAAAAMQAAHMFSKGRS